MAKRQQYEESPWNGILCINKPQGYTSFDVIARMRGILGTRRLGHAGTLDPMATGVLPVFVGRATRACDLIPEQGKVYRAAFQLGLVSDTQDIWGSCRGREGLPRITRSQLEEVLGQFRGNISQLPPMYSAIQVDGQRLYDLARQGLEVERQPREIQIHRLELLRFSPEFQQGELEVECSKGTYIRTLCSDIGDALGTGGVMTGLCRIQAAGFTLEDCITLEELEQLSASGQVEGRLHPIGTVFSRLPAVHLDESRTRMYCNGVVLDLRRITYPRTDEPVRVMGSDGRFLGIAQLDQERMLLKSKKIFVGR